MVEATRFGVDFPTDEVDPQDGERGNDGAVPRSSDLIGLPVLSGQRFKRIGRVCEVLVHPDGARICGLVLDPGGLFRPRRVLDFKAVKAVRSTHLLADEVYCEDVAQTCCGGTLQGLPVLDGAGDELGTMDDIHFDPSTGRIVAMQLSRGFVDDLLGGKGIVAVGERFIAGEGAISLAAPAELAGGLADEVPEL